MKKILSFILLMTVLLSLLCITICAADTTSVLGDMNGDAVVDINDAIYLLKHTMMPSRYPVSQPGDVNGTGDVNIDDAIYLLKHTMMPSRYPIVILGPYYTITWENSDGSVLKTTLCAENKIPSFGDVTPTMESDSQYSYTFDRWATEIVPATEDATYVAIYNKVPRTTYTISYDANGGTNAPASQSKSKGETVTLTTSVPTYAGKDFAFWICANDGKIYNAGASFNIDADVTLYAVWGHNCSKCSGVGSIKSTYTCVTCSGGGWISQIKTRYENCTKCGGKGTVETSRDCTSCTGGIVSYKTCTCGYGAPSSSFGSSCPKCGRTRPTITILDCFACGGIGQKVTSSTCSNCSGRGEIIKEYTQTDQCDRCWGEGTITIVNICSSCKGNQVFVDSAATHTATLKNGTETIGTMSLTVNKPYKLTVPTREGYTFIGWFGSEENGTQYTNGEGVCLSVWSESEDKTLYAHWIISYYTITYDCDNNVNLSNMPSVYTIEDEDILLNVQNRDHYSFKWELEKNTVDFVDTSIAKDIVVKGIWTPIEYTIAYDLDGGEASNVTHYNIESDTFSLNIPTKTGYTFVGWTGSNGQELSSTVTITKGSFGNLSYTAHWAPRQYKVTFNANGGTLNEKAMTVIYDAPYTLPTPTRDEYTFVGWYSGETEYNGGTWITASNLTLTAKWTSNFTYTTSGSSLTITGYTGSDSTVNIPLSIDGKAVTEIAENAFANKVFIQEILVPANVTVIGDNAFKGCTNLTIYTNATSKPAGWSTNWNPDNRQVVWGYRKVTGISLNRTKAMLESKGETLQLNATVAPDNALNKNVIWVSSDTSVVKVDKNGLITEVGNGKALITAITEDGSFTATCEVTVNTNLKYYKYSVTNGEVTITDVDTAISGKGIIPDTLGGYPVTSIGEDAFKDCTSLTSIAIPDSVTSIGESAFSGCSSLTGVYITDIAAWCGISFDDYSANPLYYAGKLYLNGTLVTDLIIPEGVTSIGDYAFCYCKSLTSVTIGNSVISIGDRAFWGCSSLTSVTIGNGVTSIGSSAFGLCSGLRYNKYDNAYYLGNETNPYLVLAEAKNTSINTCTIHQSTKIICSHAFSGCTSLTSVTIPDSVTSIGSLAFRWCSGLTSVYITDIAAWCGIRFGDTSANPLYYTDSLYLNGELVTDIIIPEGVISIGRYAFYDCDILTSVTIGNGVTSIGADAFSYCSNLTSVSIPDSVIFIGGSAFLSCDSLVGVYITDIAAWCGIRFGDSYANPLSEARKLYLNGTLVTDLVIPDGVTSIGNLAFCNCYSLTSVTIPDSVTSIGDSAFWGCSSLTGVYITDIAAWCKISLGNDYANPLYYAKKLYLNGELVTELVIPDSVTSMDEDAFAYCESLTSITIPDSVTSIGDYAFYKCSSLTSVTIGNSVTSIGEYAFRDCSSLTSVNITDIAAWCKISLGNDYANPLYYAKKLYLNGELVTELVIPDSVTSMDEDAFAYCESLTSITIPDSVTSIGRYAFYNCTKLTSVTIPNSVTSIGNYAFSGCSSLEYNEYDNAYYLGNETNPYLVLIKAKTTSINSCTIHQSTKIIYSSAFSGCSSLTSVTIPDSVTSIGNSAFRDCDSLTSVTIGDSVTSIGNYAFRDCSSLTSVTIGNGVTSIGNYAFYKCSSLIYNEYDNAYYLGNETNPYLVLIEAKTTSINSCTIHQSTKIIYSDAFYNCSSLTSITIPDSVTSIGDSAFFSCSKLTGVYITDIAAWYGIRFGDSYANPLSEAGKLYLNGELITDLVIPNGVTSIGKDAFHNCDSLTSVTIGNGVTSIGDDAFRGCSNLTSITIPDSVTSIGKDAFYYCTSLTSVTIGGGVTSIGSSAFMHCSSLEKINYRGSQQQWSAISKASNWDVVTGNYTITYNYTGK